MKYRHLNVRRGLAVLAFGAALLLPTVAWAQDEPPRPPIPQEPTTPVNPPVNPPIDGGNNGGGSGGGSGEVSQPAVPPPTSSTAGVNGAPVMSPPAYTAPGYGYAQPSYNYNGGYYAQGNYRQPTYGYSYNNGYGNAYNYGYNQYRQPTYGYSNRGYGYTQPYAYQQPAYNYNYGYGYQQPYQQRSYGYGSYYGGYRQPYSYGYPSRPCP